MKLYPLIFAVACLPYVWAAQGAPSKPSADTSVRVQSLLKGRCGSCHGSSDPAGGLDLVTAKGIREGGASGALFTPGKPAGSLLLHRLRGDDGLPRMPKGFAPLTDEDISLIEGWIRSGGNLVETKPHWAYVAPVRPPIPSVAPASMAWCRNPIDHFVLAKMQHLGLRPSPAASKETLIRRLSLDLTGLPPTEADVDAFLHDRSPEAYEKVVDRLLASPHYGERQARVWLDLARYADSNGYEKDGERSIWPYRNWVIDAYNRNMPYDEFTIEQIAGDLLPGATLSQKIATGFNRNVMLNQEGGVDQGEQRWLRLIDMVSTTSATWLGQTMGCAQCHDHKYDPFTQKDFYQFLAFFEPSDGLDLELRPELAQRRATLRAQINREQELLKKKDPSVTEKTVEADQAKLDAVSGPWTSVFQEKPGAKPETAFHIRGGYLAMGEKVSADTPKSLPPLPANARKDRLALAKWLASPKNPLTARVEVNRMWEMLFGTGLVETSENFGTQGTPPSHPELLDWLATEFVRRKWDRKAMLKLIVMSNTYRQRSDSTPLQLKVDPKNVYLSHAPRFRMEAEMLRDNALQVSGLLSPKIGGPSVFPSQPPRIWDSPYSGETWTYSQGADRYRRGIYTFWKRTATYPAFVLLDATSREACTVRRIRTNTALQALELLNDESMMETAKGLARRMESFSSDPAKQINHGFRLCVARWPQQAEQARLQKLYAKLLERYTDAPKEAAKLAPTPQQAALTMLANVLLNLDETITKT